MQLLRSLAIGALGGALFGALSMPLAWMLGPLIANLIAAVAGVRVAVPNRLREYFLGVLGLLLGGQVTAELAARALEWPLSAALLLAGIAGSTAVGAWWYRHCGFDRVSAWFSAAPGALTAMIMLGEKAGGDPRRIAVAQSLRALFIVLVLPPFFVPYGQSASGAEPGMPATLSASWSLLALPLLISVGTRLRLPNPALLTPMLFAAVLGATGNAHLALPPWGVDGMLWVLGSAIGARFQGLKVAEILRYAWQAAISSLLSLAVLAAFAWVAHWALGIPLHVVILAFAPGGIGEMALLAVTLHIDPVFVAFHHLLRLIALLLIAPVWMSLISGSRAPTNPADP
ncbi:AbrB family transcriptional regulator [Pseudomonas sp. XS1P51]